MVFYFYEHLVKGSTLLCKDKVVSKKIAQFISTYFWRGYFLCGNHNLHTVFRDVGAWIGILYALV